MYQLRDYQSAACSSVWSYLLSTPGNPVVELPTGAGKSLCIAELCRESVQRWGGRVLVLAHRRELLQQNAEKISSLLPTDVLCGIYSAGLKMRRTDLPVICGGIQSVHKKAAEFGVRNLVIIDECFTGETLVATPGGNRRIAEIRVGDLVLNASGVGRVLSMFSKQATSILKVEVSSGCVLCCTPNHRFFTDRGWVNADCLEAGECLVDFQALPALRRRISSADQQALGHATARETNKPADVGGKAILQHSVRETAFQSGRNSGSAEKVERRSQSQGIFPEGARWERSAAASGGGEYACDPRGWVGAGSRNPDEKAKGEGRRLPNLLQAGYWEPRPENRDRVRRKFPHDVRPESCGRQERPFVVRTWMEGNQDPERTGRRTVYDLQVSGHPSYFAGGVLVHNCHLVPTAGEGMYRAFLDDLRSINPKMRMVGMTATPYRTGEGALCRPDGLFQQICYTAPIPQLISQGYLSQIISNVGDASADTSKLHIRAGEFINSELEQLFDVPAVVKAACAEIVAKSVGRQSILVFCSGVQHAKHVAQELSTLTGEKCGTVTGDTLPIERANTLSDFRNRRLRWLTNVDVLTTGFDAPCIDCIAILRATCSPGLFSQICGRGFRLFPGKSNALILDFGENILRHGPLDAIDFGKPKKKNPDAEAPTKKCINCEQDVPLSAAVCPFCGFQFPPRELKHGEEADKLAQILSKPQDWLVEEVNMSRHKKAKSIGVPDTLRVDYICRVPGYEGNLALEKISEWICLDHDGWAGQKAQAWWRRRSDASPVADDNGSWIDSCIDWWKRGAVATPTRITTIREGKFYRITNYVLDPIPPEENWLAEAVRGDVFETEELPF